MRRLSVVSPIRRAGAIAAMTAAVVIGSVAPAASADVVNVYSYRQPFLVEPLFDAFTKETGVEVKVVFAKKGLVERLKAEGSNSPADLIFTVDIGRLADAQAAGVTQPIQSAVLDANVPEQYRDPDGHWVGMTTRARIIYASKDRVAPGEITSYEDLSDPKWEGRICTRSGKHVYNVALFSSMIAHYGLEKAEAWLAGLKSNLARKPQGNDRAQVKAISEGECDLSLGNHYYYGAMLADDEQKAWAEAVNLVFPNQTGEGMDARGTHVNVSGVALTKSAPNKANAVKLVEFLAAGGQTLYAEINYEYPVNPTVAWLPEVEAWGKFKADTLDLAAIAELRAEAARMVDRVGYND